MDFDLKRTHSQEKCFDILIDDEALDLFEPFCQQSFSYLGFELFFDIWLYRNKFWANIEVDSVGDYEDTHVFVDLIFRKPNGDTIMTDRKWLEIGVAYDFALMTVEEMTNWTGSILISVEMKYSFYLGHVEHWDLAHMFMEGQDLDVWCSASRSSDFHTIRMEKMLKCPQFADVTFVCDDGVNIPCHKNILFNFSYFGSLFGSSFGGADEKEIIVGYNSSTMRTMLVFMYSGRVEEKQVDNWPDLFVAASFYQVGELAMYCELAMMSRVDREDWISIRHLIRFASIFSACKLRRFLILLSRKKQET